MRTSTLNGVMWMMMAIRDDGYDIGCTNLVQMISNVYRFYQNQQKSLNWNQRFLQILEKVRTGIEISIKIVQDHRDILATK